MVLVSVGFVMVFRTLFGVLPYELVLNGNSYFLYIYFASSLLLSILGGNYRCVGMEMAIVGEAIEDVFMYNLLFFWMIYFT